MLEGAARNADRLAQPADYNFSNPDLVDFNTAPASFKAADPVWSQRFPSSS